jgi:hypothetical protein
VGFFASLTFAASASVVVDQAFVPTGTVLSARSSSYLLPGGAGGPLDGFAPGGSDKLVVACSSEAGGVVAVTAVTYGGQALRPAVRANSPAERHHAAIYYLDNPPASGDLRIEFGDSGRFGIGVSLLALSGTTDGVGTTEAVIGQNEVSLTTTIPSSLVLFANIFNGGSGSQSPDSLQQLINAEVGSASHGAGYRLVNDPGEVTARFDDSESGENTVTLAVCFPAGSSEEPPVGDPILQSHDWGQPLQGFNNHEYLSEVGPASIASVAPTETWVQYLSGTDKDNTVDWYFYVTKWGKVQQWNRLPVPSCWEMHGYGRLTYYDEDSGEKGSYNYKFRVPEAWEGQRRVEIVFEGVAVETSVYVNGQALASAPHAGGFYRFSYDVTDQLDYTGVNLLEVHVDNDSPNHPGLVAAEGGDYWRYGGIYRPVYLQAKPTASIDYCAIDARADGSLRAELELQGIQQAGRITAQVINADGESVGQPIVVDLVAGQEMVELNGQFADPLLWSAEFPNLHHLELQLEVGGQAAHTLRERFGFRTVEVRPGEGFFVNGEKVIIKGVNRHTMWPDSGKTVSEAVDRLDIERMKEMNMNAVRAGHYPPDKRFIELCDELGIYVLEELASCQNLLPTATGIPLVRAMIRRDVNSPSVILWSNGNEGGHNPQLDPYFKEADIQQRPVVYARHGRDPVDGIITDHYEPYTGIQEIIQEEEIYIATELAHGLYDGGGGAGLEDRWRLMMDAPLTQGLFVWALLDEGIRRYHLGGRLDTRGNMAPDGMVGPYREREGSFYTIRELFSPIHIEMRELPELFDGRIEIENRYNFTNANQCSFNWELVSFRGPASVESGHVVDHHGTAVAPSIPPGTNPDFSRGWLDLNLPTNWQDSDALHLTAIDPHGRDLWTWTWVTGTAVERRTEIVQAGNETVTVREEAGHIVLVSGGVEVAFDTGDGRLVEVTRDGQILSFGNGPVLVTGTQTFEQIQHFAEGANHVVEVSYSGDMRSAKWTMLPGGWLKLDYHYHLTGEVPFMGISFDYPESKVNSMTWLGRGPFRVWKNRLKGGSWDVWNKDYNQTATGYPESVDPYEYPEFKGYHADVRWVVLHTDEGDFTFVADDESLFFRNFSADYAAGDNRGVDPAFPKGDISFLDGIAPQSNKISVVDAPLMGPQGEPNRPNGDYRRTLYFRFSMLEQDNDSPLPNPSSFLIPPSPAGTGTIAMVATTAEDFAGPVEYFFENISNGNSSGWITATRWSNDGLTDGQSYTYRVKTRDALGNAGNWSAEASAVAGPDLTPPDPDPAAWDQVPLALGETSITMSATTALDINGVAYFFEAVAGGGHDSGWQASPTYIDTGLTPETAYSYRVRTRDLSSGNNTGGESSTLAATTDAPDTTPPTPNPMAFATAPFVTGGSSIEMIAATASDESGVEYYFEETSGNPGGNDSGWQTGTTYTDTGLTTDLTYSYRVKARDSAPDLNETAYSPTASATPTVPDEVQVLDTGFNLNNDDSPVTDAELSNLDFTGASKLVVTVGVKGSNLSPDNQAGTVTYNGTAMTLAVGTAGTADNSWGWVGIYYLDDPAAVGVGPIVVEDPGYSLAVSAVVLSGTAAGVGATTSSVTQDFVNLDIAAGSVVVAGSSDGSSSDNTVVAPLVELGSGNFGSGGHVHGYQEVPTAGAYTASFEVSGSRPSTAGAEFPAASTASTNTFAEWIAAQPGVHGQTGVTDDPDGDGIANLIENFFGTEPGAFSQGLVTGTVDPGANTFSFTHPLNASPADDLTATYRWSTDLSTFYIDGEANTAGTTTVSFVQSGSIGGVITVTATIGGAVIPERLFVAVEVTN